MEVRTLAQCLRASSRPMLRSTRPNNRFMTLSQRCYASSDSNDSTGIPSTEELLSSLRGTPKSKSKPKSNANPDSNSNANADADANSNTSELKNSRFSISSDADAILRSLDLSNIRETSKTIRRARQEEGERAAIARKPITPQRVFVNHMELSKTVGTNTVSSINSNRSPLPLPTQHATALPRVDLKLGPELGRQVHVDPIRGVDLAAALRNLNINCAKNQVRSQANAQRFHVRRGQMQKNLRMQRWRRLFKFSFKETVSKIQKMRAQGW